MALKKAKSRGEANKRQTEVVSIGRALRPSFDLFVSLQVMPCLSSSLVQKPPSLDVSSLWFIDRNYRRAVLVLLVAVGIAI